MPRTQKVIFDSKNKASPNSKKKKALTASNSKLMNYFSAVDMGKADSKNNKNSGGLNAKNHNHYEQKYKEGIDEALKETVKEQYKNQYKFYGLLNRTSRLIHKLRNIIPILTTEILIDPTKVTIVHRPFFFSEHIQSIAVGDIDHIWIETAPFFATMKIIEKGYTDNVIQIRWLWKNKAEKTRRLIMGLVEAKREEIDLTAINQEELVVRLEEIGKLQETNTSVSSA